MASTTPASAAWAATFSAAAVVDQLGGDDVYVIQPTGPPVSGHLLELLLLLDACRRDGAGRIIAVVPYSGYARQDRRSQSGGPVGARVVADSLASSGTRGWS